MGSAGRLVCLERPGRAAWQGRARPRNRVLDGAPGPSSEPRGQRRLWARGGVRKRRPCRAELTGGLPVSAPAAFASAAEEGALGQLRRKAETMLGEAGRFLPGAAVNASRPRLREGRSFLLL